MERWLHYGRLLAVLLLVTYRGIDPYKATVWRANCVAAAATLLFGALSTVTNVMGQGHRYLIRRLTCMCVCCGLSSVVVSFNAELSHRRSRRLRSGWWSFPRLLEVSCSTHSNHAILISTIHWHSGYFYLHVAFPDLSGYPTFCTQNARSRTVCARGAHYLSSLDTPTIL